MKTPLRVISLILIAVLLFASCKKKADTPTDIGGEAIKVDESFSKSASDMFTDRDLDPSYDEGSSISIHLNGTSATSSSSTVSVSGSTVTITAEATYIITGTLENGQIIVDAPKEAKLQLVLKGASVSCAKSAPLYIKEADKVFVTLADGTSNTLSGGDSFSAIDESNIDAALFSKQDLTLNGSGSLTVTSPAGHGITCKDDLVITGGSYAVTCASHGLDANDSVRLRDASLTIDAGKDGIHAENSDDASLGFVFISNGTVKIEAEGDGISAASTLQIDDGRFDVLTGGGSVNGSKQTSDSYGGFMGGGHPGGHPSSRPSQGTSQGSSSTDSGTSIKGIKASGSVLIANGSFTLDTADDSFHSNTDMLIKGGSFTIASGDDAFHADNTLSIVGGGIKISTSYEGLEGLNVSVLGGDIRIVASDDGINAAGGTDASGTGGRGGDMFGGGSSKGSIAISGGTLYINASGDGLDANGTLTISGGHTTVCGPTMGDTATLDYDVSGVITGGTFIGTGASNMAQTFSDSTQGVLSLSVGNQTAGTTVTVTDSDGNIVLSYAPALSYQIVIISSPSILKGEKYTVSVGNSSGQIEAS